MKEDPIFIFSAYVRNKLTGVTGRIGRAIMKLRKVSRNLESKEIDDAIQELIMAGEKVTQIFSRTDKFLGKLRLRQERKKIVTTQVVMAR